MLIWDDNPHALASLVDRYGGQVDLIHIEPPLTRGRTTGVTRRLVAAAAVAGLGLRAHVVVTADGWYDCTDRELVHHPWPVGIAA